MKIKELEKREKEIKEQEEELQRAKKEVEAELKLTKGPGRSDRGSDHDRRDLEMHV